MTQKAWYSQLFENSSGGGVLLALPYERLSDWKGEGDDYDDLIEEVDQFLLHPLGTGSGLFVTDEDGVHEAHWMRFEQDPGVTLVIWSEWVDPARPTVPDDWTAVARAWSRGEDPRQAWLEEQLARDGLDWERLDPPQEIRSGVLFLLHAEQRPLKARFAKPRAVASDGQCVPVGLAPGRYQIETLVLNELPEGGHFCLVCRWTPADEGSDD